MPRKLLRRILPSLDWVKRQRWLKAFGQWLHSPWLWHLNRRSVAMGVGVALFSAFFPIPPQMLLAAALALILRGNLPIALVLVWISNPLTFPAILYLDYQVGSLITGYEWYQNQLTWSFSQLSYDIGGMLLPIMIGSLVLGFIVGIAGYLITRTVWRYTTIAHWRKRAKRRPIIASPLVKS